MRAIFTTTASLEFIVSTILLFTKTFCMVRNWTQKNCIARWINKIVPMITNVASSWVRLTLKLCSRKEGHTSAITRYDKTKSPAVAAIPFKYNKYKTWYDSHIVVNPCNVAYFIIWNKILQFYYITLQTHTTLYWCS